MGVIKVNLSKVYAKARDRNYTHLYKKGKRAPCTLTLRTVHFHTGNSSLINHSKRKIVISTKHKITVPEKTYETVRLCLIKKLSNVYPQILKSQYLIKFTRYPHQLLRFHAIASGVRADRISQGMSNAFGTAFMKACKLKPNDSFIQIYLHPRLESKLEEYIPELKKVMSKVPFKPHIRIDEI